MYLEALEKTLDAWTTFFTSQDDLPGGLLGHHAGEIFNTYVQCHLAAPDGTRNLVSGQTVVLMLLMVPLCEYHEW